MPVNFKIFAEHGFVLVQYQGHVVPDEVVNAARDYASDPGYKREQNILADLTGFASTDSDFVGIMQTIALVADHLKAGQTDRLVVYVASSPKAQAIVHFIANSMAAVPGFVVRIAESHQDAFNILGVSTANYDCQWAKINV